MKYLVHILLFLFGFKGLSQAPDREVGMYAPKDYYLVDSLDLKAIDESDKSLIDSCLKVYHTAKHDTDKVQAIGFLVEECWDDNVWPKYNRWVYQFIEKKLRNNLPASTSHTLKVALASALDNYGYMHSNRGNLEKALEYYLRVFKIHEEMDDTLAMSASANDIGYIYDDMGNMQKALEYYRKSLKFAKAVGDKPGMAISLNNIGNVYTDLGDIKKALEYNHKSIKIKEEIGNKRGLAVSLNNIGFIHKTQGDTSLALKYYEKSLDVEREIGDKLGIGVSLINIAYIYKNKGDKEKALKYFFESLEIQKTINDMEGMSYSLQGIGNIYNTEGKTDEALKYFYESLKVGEKIADKEGVVYSLNAIGRLELDMGKLSKARENFERAFDLSNQLGYPKLISQSALSLSELAQKQSKYKEALEMYKLHKEMEDSLKNQENQKLAIKQQARYEYERKAAEDSVAHAKEKEIKQAEIEKQKAKVQAKQNQQYALVGGILLVMLFSGFMYNRYKITQKQKIVIEEQKEEVETQRDQIDRQRANLQYKNEEVAASINYAKRIQNAIMPSISAVKEALKNIFVLYLPKDIVAGDFYWMEQVGDSVFFAAADCTGHGVPGAMVSVVCSNALTKSLLEENITDTGNLLDRTREIVIERLARSGEEVKDGMDISLCKLNLKTKELQWSGANNPLWILRNDADEFDTIKANKQPVGIHPVPQPFVSHQLQLSEGDQIYIFTDGYQDQFGGADGKKFKARQLKKILLANREKNINEQKEILHKKFMDWKGSEEQIDDVCVIGVQV